MNLDPFAPSQSRVIQRIALGLAVLVVTLGGCASDPTAPWNQPEYGSRYCLNCDEVKGALGAAEFGPAQWIASPNFSPMNRKVGDVKVVIMHTVQGSYNGCISWFQNPTAQVSAHYVVSKTGAVTQMVLEKDKAWHVGSENSYTIGIEHEGYVTDPAWVTPQMVEASTQLTCYLLKKWGLPATNDTIKGHVQLPNQTHTDPGQYWPYADYLAKVQTCMGGGTVPTCTGGCDDGKACTDDTCNNGVCAHSPNTGAVCWDGDACTAGEKCNNGACIGGKIVKDCNDNNACTDDGCTGGNCTHSNNTAGCDDGDACTASDHCGGGKCTGSPAPCDDGNGCTVGDVCVGGTCQPGQPKNCDDGNPCTKEFCAAGSCTSTPITGACDDGDPCTAGDSCATGKCKGTSTFCDDGNPCTLDSCAGGCQNTPITGPCDDGDACSVGDYCAGGLCLSGAPTECDDGFACTVDSCEAGECKHSGGSAPSVATCQGINVLATDPCGGPAVEQVCPAGRPCQNGKCQASSDVTGGDASGGDGLSYDGSGDIASAGQVPNGAPASGCSTSGGSAPVWPMGAGVAVLVLAVGLRRRIRS
jgi:MYXO-CTERM domain-containing protein